MSKVIVTQQVITRDENNAWKPIFDLSPATRYGELNYIFGAGQIILGAKEMADFIDDRLDEIDYDPKEDYLLATGDMSVAIAVASRMLVAADGSGIPIKVLRWDKREKSYNVVEVI